MKVGVRLNYCEPQLGGCFSFEGDIFRALIELSSESKHSFVILSDGEYHRSLIDHSKKFRFVNLTSLRRRQLRRRINIRLAQAHNRLVRGMQKVPMLRRGWLNWSEQVVQDIGLDIIWNVTPHGMCPRNVPFISTVLDLQHRLQPWFPEVTADRKFREHYFSYLMYATFVIVGTKAGKSEVSKFYQVPPERIRLIPHPTPRFALNERQQNQRDEDEKVLDKYKIPAGYLLYPAQFWAHKNHVNLLLAIRLLRDSYDIVFQLVLVGSDKGNKRYVQQAVKRLDLGKQVHFLGFVSEKELVSLYRNAFALTYLSFFGPENLPPLEAFALGCPVIASNVSGASEQLGDAALLVDPRNEKQIADAIKSIHDDDALRQTLVARGMARASKWTGEDFVRSVFSILDEFEAVRRCWGSETRQYVL
jgi:glycosyltransferase involved in cell wall biosynthesis